MDMSQYLEIFIEETKEHLQSMNQCMLDLEKDKSDVAILNEIFRVAHTLKGMSGTMGFSRMAKLTHDMENVLQALRSSEIKVTPDIIDVLFRCFDALEGYLEEITNSGENEGTNENRDIIVALNRIIKTQATPKVQFTKADKVENKAEKIEEKKVESKKFIKRERVKTGESFIDNPTADITLNQYDTNVIKKAFEENLNVYRITIVLSKSCVLKAARSFIIFQTLEKNSEIIKSQPSVQDIEDERFDTEFTVIVITKHTDEILSKHLNQIAEVEKVLITMVDVDEYCYQEVDVNGSGELEKTEENIEVLEVKEKQSKLPTKTGKTVRVDIARLDNLMNLASELVIIKTRLEGLHITDNSSSDYVETIEYLERITSSLHDAVMKVRMVPVETVFNRFPRMIRDVARDIKKEIVLTMSGEETELDRTVIDEIGDPLIHLLRNSADHGIETPEVRKAAGKTNAGHIILKAYQDGNTVVIEVQDDGGGINTERVKKKAIDNNIVSKEVANTLSKKEIIEFLFAASFSTADKVTDLSGRGVGLDVVKTKIESLGGVVEVETELGKGSSFIIRLPLTLAIIQALLVNVAHEKYAIPLGSIKEIVKIKPDDVKMIQKREGFYLRDLLIPIVRLDKFFSVKREEEFNPKNHTIVVVKKGEKLTGILVDSLIGQHEIVIKSLGKLLSGTKFISGATILGDGNVALIVDINSLI